MAPNLLGKSTLYSDEPSSAEPVQIISKPEFQHETSTYTKPIARDPTQKYYKLDIVWRNVLIFLVLHIFAVIGLFHWMFTVKWYTMLYGYFIASLIAQGITSGAHRLWAHRCYKANLPLRIILGFLQTAALQNDIYEWSRDHRVHHKFTDTDADPHNASRGFFFSHMGWLLCKKHKDVMIKGKTIDMSDLEADPVVQFQRKYYVLLAPICCFVIPSVIPWYFWNEDPYLSFVVCGIFRYVLSLHVTWLVNSAAHIFGTKPYDKSIKPVECRAIALVVYGEGWHNYHHTFPWDYKAAELGNYVYNISTGFIDFFAKLGWAYDLKTASVDMIEKRVKRTGDGSYEFRYSDNQPEIIKTPGHIHGHVWGWGDVDMKDYDKKFVEIYNKGD